MNRFFKRFKCLSGIAVISVISLLTVSCGGGGGGSKGPDSTPITLSATSVQLSNTGGSTVIKLTTTASWTASATAGITVTPSSGKGSADVTIRAAQNTGSTTKTGTVTFTGGGTSVTVTITQQPVQLSADPQTLNLDGGDGATGTFTITSNVDWEIATGNKPTWLTSVSPAKGSSGTTTVTVTTSANPEKNTKNYILGFAGGGTSGSIVLVKGAGPNNAPTKPADLSPTGSNVDLAPLFTWTASTDADGDAISYTVAYSKDQTTWTNISASTSNQAFVTTALDANTTYYWKVIASDGYEEGTTESDVVSFTTGSTQTRWADLQVKQYEIASDGSPVEVTLGSNLTGRVFLIYSGDGYTADLFEYGGQFDREVDAGIKALFEIEPYKSFTNLFTVFKVAAFSNEAGLSQGDEWNSPKAGYDYDTRFKCTWEGGNSTGIDVNKDAVVDALKQANVPLPAIGGVTNANFEALLTWSPISIIINADQYAGTNWGYINPNGYRVLSIACTPARHRTSGYGGFENTLRHEFGGHGFGLLGDEYSYTSQGAMPEDRKNRMQWWYDYCGYYANIEWAHSMLADARWAGFAADPNYAGAAIGMYEGAATYISGAYRSEPSSCMIDNHPHFNTISRYQIYCRIQQSIRGNRTYKPTEDEFKAIDVDIIDPYTSSSTQRSNTKGSSSAEYRKPTEPRTVWLDGSYYKGGKKYYLRHKTKAAR